MKDNTEIIDFENIINGNKLKEIKPIYDRIRKDNIKLKDLIKVLINTYKKEQNKDRLEILANLILEISKDN